MMHSDKHDATIYKTNPIPLEVLRWLPGQAPPPGAAVGWSESKISRIETGRVGIRQPDLERLLDLYEVTGEERAALVALGRQAAHRGWWHSFAAALPAWFGHYVGLED